MNWRRVLILSMLALAGCSTFTASQPQRLGAVYSPILDETGAQFRADVNARFAGSIPVSPSIATSAWDSLPASPYLYQQMVITDANACAPGSAITAGGGSYCPAMYNGSNWRPMGSSTSGGSGFLYAGTGLRAIGSIVTLNVPVSLANGARAPRRRMARCSIWACSKAVVATMLC